MTPIEVNGLDQGMHSLRLTRSGFDETSVDFQAVDRVTLVISATLKPAKPIK
jgi:hypothetical protein